VAWIGPFRHAREHRSPPCAAASEKAARTRSSRQAESLLRPFARRRASTRRPPLEAMRAMKPCSRFLARFLGWYVCLDMGAGSSYNVLKRFRFVSGPITHERLAHASLTRWPRGPVSLGVDSTVGPAAGQTCARDGPGATRRLRRAPSSSRSSSAGRLESGRAERRALWPLSAPDGGVTLARPPGPDVISRLRHAPREAYDSGPLGPRGASDWRSRIDGCEAGVARRPW